MPVQDGSTLLLPRCRILPLKTLPGLLPSCSRAKSSFIPIPTPTTPCTRGSVSPGINHNLFYPQSRSSRNLLDVHPPSSCLYLSLCHIVLV